MMELRTVIFKGNQEAAFADAALIRETVFLDEQQFSRDFDDVDEYAWHVVVYNGDTPVATGRYFADEQSVHHIGRVAVQKIYRGQKVGAYLMKQLEQVAASQGAKEITIGAQVRASRFYGKQGYLPYGDVFYDEYCEHISMKKTL